MNDKPTIIANDIDVQAIEELDRSLPEPQGLLAPGIQVRGVTPKDQLFSRIQSMGRVNRVGRTVVPRTVHLLLSETADSDGPPTQKL